MIINREASQLCLKLEILKQNWTICRQIQVKSKNRLNDRITQNKRLYNEVNRLERLLQERDIENEKLNDELNTLLNSNTKLMSDNESLDRKVFKCLRFQVSELSQIKIKNNTRIENLLEENENLKGACKNQDSIISNLEKEKLNLINKNEELSREIKVVYSKMKNKDENISYLNKQLDDAFKNIEILKVN